MRLLFLVAIGVALVAPRTRAYEADDAWAALEKAEKFELYSLDPAFGDENKDGFYGWKLLGQTTVKDADLRKKLVTTLADAIDNFTGRGQCFDPRHAIRVEAGRKSYDFLICFECKYVYIYSNKKQIAMWNTLAAPRELFNKTLEDAKVPLPKSRDK